MSLSHWSVKTRWIAGLVLGLLIVVHSDAVTVTAEAQPKEVRPNQSFNFSIIIEGGNPQAVPSLRLPLQIGMSGGPSQSSEIQIVNNTQSIRIRFTWPLVASEPGDFVIAPQDVQVGGQMVKTNEVKVTIKEGAQPEQKGNEPLLQISVDKTEFFQSEVVPIKAALYIHRSTNLRRIGLVEVAKTDFAIQRFPQQSEQSLEMIGDQPYYVLTFRSTLSALRTGKLEVGPASMEVLIDEPAQDRGGFPPGFFLQTGEPRKFAVKSPAVPVTVLPLPTEGRPADFTGAVGDFTLNATASPNALAVGEPITVELSVTGVGNFDALTSPALTNPKGWKTYPSRRYNTNGQPDPNQPTNMERQIGFTQVLVPESQHAEVPPFELSFFSASSKKYVTLRTPPIPVTIKPSATAAPIPADATAALAGGAPVPSTAREPEPEITDIVEHLPKSPHWISVGNTSWHENPVFWLINGIPVLLLMGGSLRFAYLRYQERRVSSPGYALRQIWQGLHEAGVSEAEFYRRAAHFIRATGEMNPNDKIKAVLDHYEAANFSGVAGTGAHQVSNEQRSEVLAALAPLMAAQRVNSSSILSGSGTPVAASLLLFGFMVCPASSATPDQRYGEITQSIQKRDYTRAQTLTESLLDSGSLSPELFEIMAHTRYRQGDFGRAALWYERAALFNPFSAELRQNLRHLDEKLRYLKFPPATLIQSFGLLLYRNTWLGVASVGFWLLTLGLAVSIASGSGSVIRRLSFIGIFLGAFLVPIGALGAAARPNGEKRVKDVFVVTKEGAKAFTAASTTAGTVIDLPPGSQIRLHEKRGAWSYVEIPSMPDNLRGWVETDMLTSLWPNEWPVNLLP